MPNNESLNTSAAVAGSGSALVPVKILLLLGVTFIAVQNLRFWLVENTV